MNQKIRAILVGLAIAALVTPSALASPQGTGRIEGIAKDASQRPIAGVIVSCRNAATGQAAGSQQTSSSGTFSITGLLPGTYIVEVVDRDGKIVGVSPVLTLTPGSMTAAGVSIAATAAGSVDSAPGGPRSFLKSTKGLVILGGIGAAAVAGVVVATRADASAAR
jgi:hypothetical protein